VWPKISWSTVTSSQCPVSNNRYTAIQLLVYSIQILFYLMLFFLQKWLSAKINQARSRVRILSINICAAPYPRVVVTKLTTTKTNSEGFPQLSTKISTPENYPSYGNTFTITIIICDHCVACSVHCQLPTTNLKQGFV
jgi:hypothetical protein